MPKIDVAAVKRRTGSSYPEPYASQMGARSFQSLGDAAGLTQFGASLVTMEPGATSSLRHWHSAEDEFVWVVSGELVLAQDGGETVLRPGDAAGFKAGDADGHHIKNRSGDVASFLVVGTRAETDVCSYSDVDMEARTEGGRTRFVRRDGTLLKEILPG